MTDAMIDAMTDVTIDAVTDAMIDAMTEATTDAMTDVTAAETAAGTTDVVKEETVKKTRTGPIAASLTAQADTMTVQTDAKTNSHGGQTTNEIVRRPETHPARTTTVRTTRAPHQHGVSYSSKRWKQNSQRHPQQWRPQPQPQPRQSHPFGCDRHERGGALAGTTGECAKRKFKR